MTKTIIITAGGKGLRMGAELPKQFILINGKPILLYTLELFFRYDPKIEIILVLPDAHISYWQELIVKHKVSIHHHIAVGGKTRYHSIKNGLIIATGKLIGVHDGVRPFTSNKVIIDVFKAAEQFGAAIPTMPLVESIRKVNGQNSEALDRSRYVSVQTPQCFQAPILKAAYSLEYQNNFTDDASVVEASGAKINLVDGNAENIKITTPFDLRVAAALISRNH